MLATITPIRWFRPKPWVSGTAEEVGEDKSDVVDVDDKDRDGVEEVGVAVDVEEVDSKVDEEGIADEGVVVTENGGIAEEGGVAGEVVVITGSVVVSVADADVVGAGETRPPYVQSPSNGIYE